MGTTPVFALPYPELNEAADVPADMHELALAVDTNLDVVDDKVTAEVAARQNADTAETTARQNADTAETNARVAADQTLTTRVAAEETARANGDTTLDGKITAETNARTAADQTLTTNLATEKTDRQFIDSQLQTQVDYLIARPMTMGGFATVAFVNGVGHVTFGVTVRPTKSTISVVVSGAEAAAFNCWFNVSAWDVNGFDVWAWNGATNAPYVGNARISWVAVYTK